MAVFISLHVIFFLMSSFSAEFNNDYRSTFRPLRKSLRFFRFISKDTFVL